MKVEIPKICPYCGSSVILTSNAEIYGREYGNRKCYKCTKCDSYVGVHTGSIIPLGTLANSELRKWRNKAHIEFDKLWKGNTKKMSRGMAYKWLSDKMNLKQDETHIALFNVEQCKECIKILEGEK